MSKTQIVDLYNQVAADYGQMGPKILEHFGQRLVHMAGVYSNSRILDIASGRGASLFKVDGQHMLCQQ